MSKNILFVLEGEKTEPKFLKKIVSLMRIYDNYEIFSYRANLYQMLEGMLKDGEIDSDLDFIEYLKSCKTNKEDQYVLEKKFSDIFLFFDMDPQDQLYDSDKLAKAIEYFGDSTDNGKLYINYPMFESFKHISNLDDLSYLDTMVARKDIVNYKGTVNGVGMVTLSDFSRIDESTMLKIILLNLRKANMILGNGSDIPSVESYDESTSQGRLLNAQIGKLNETDKIYVLNTCVFNTIDYNPSRFYERVATDGHLE